MAENPYFVYSLPVASSLGGLPKSYVTNTYSRLIIRVAHQSASLTPLPFSLFGSSLAPPTPARTELGGCQSSTSVHIPGSNSNESLMA